MAHSRRIQPAKPQISGFVSSRLVVRVRISKEIHPKCCKVFSFHTENHFEIVAIMQAPATCFSRELGEAKVSTRFPHVDGSNVEPVLFMYIR